MMSTKKADIKPVSQSKGIVASKILGSPLAKARRSGKRILVVDDEAMFVMMCKKTLTKVGFEVTTMTDAEEALDRFKMNPFHFDIVIADKSMPKLDGYELAEKLIEIRSGVPIIIASGYKADIEKGRRTKTAIRGYAIKPISITDLVAMIDVILNEGEQG